MSGVDSVALSFSQSLRTEEGIIIRFSVDSCCQPPCSRSGVSDRLGGRSHFVLVVGCVSLPCVAYCLTCRMFFPRVLLLCAGFAPFSVASLLLGVVLSPLRLQQRRQRSRQPWSRRRFQCPHQLLNSRVRRQEFFRRARPVHLSRSCQR